MMFVTLSHTSSLPGTKRPFVTVSGLKISVFSGSECNVDTKVKARSNV